MKEYLRWLEKDLEDKDLTKELLSVKGNDEEINDRFYRELEFGTGGLRGVLGAGTNRINVYTIAKATQGLANYLNKTNSSGKELSVAIAYDSRNKGIDFANVSARVLAANGIKAYIYKELMPTPALSFAVRYLKCDAGICVTASHNPAKYNGYKAYDSVGCQIQSEMADGITNEINNTDVFDDIKYIEFDDGIKNGEIAYIGEDCFESFISCVLNEKILDSNCSNLNVVYTPLNGSGKRCVMKVLEEIAVNKVTLVEEQSEPDGDFPTCPYPNPEFQEALQKGLDLCEKEQPDLLLATDPDCDRVGIAVNQNGKFVLMSGNEVGVLLLDFIARFKTEQNIMPENPIAVSTIVSTDMIDDVAKTYGLEIVRVLTGFKYIGEIIASLEEKNRTDRYLLGFEESYGYLKGAYVRDKDAVNASMLICEMASYYKSKGKTLAQVMSELYEKYGFYINVQNSFTFEGEEGMNKMSDILDSLRKNPPSQIASYKVVGSADYQLSKDYTNGTVTDINLPKSNVIEYRLENGSKLIVRPSGTEPKIKLYISAKGKTQNESKEIVRQMEIDGKKLLGV